MIAPMEDTKGSRSSNELQPARHNHQSYLVNLSLNITERRFVQL